MARQKLSGTARSSRAVRLKTMAHANHTHHAYIDNTLKPEETRHLEMSIICVLKRSTKLIWARRKPTPGVNWLSRVQPKTHAPPIPLGFSVFYRIASSVKSLNPTQ